MKERHKLSRLRRLQRWRYFVLLAGICAIVPLAFPACHCTDEVDDEANALNVARGDTESQRDVGEDADVTAVDDAGDAGDTGPDDTGTRDTEDIGPDDAGPQDTGADDAGDVQDGDEDTGGEECGDLFDPCVESPDCCPGLTCNPEGECMIISG